jgi:hypothetical protein
MHPAGLRSSVTPAAVSLPVPPGRRWLSLLACAALLLTAPASAQSLRPREFRVGELQQVDQLPAGRFRDQLRALPDAARQRSLRWLQSFQFTEHDLDALHADARGGIYYVCEAVRHDRPQPSLIPEVSEAPVPVNPFPANLKFHSRPGAPNVIFLNFAGEVVSNTEWNSSLGRATINAVPFSTDFDRTRFSDSEQAAIKRIWQRVAEDYAPFNVDVTTERPATFNSRTANVVITRATDESGQPNPAEVAGGVAYVNVFGTLTFARFRPAWVYHDNLADQESYIAEAASHEAGHNLGLSHDGTTDGSEYYGGHGSGEISWGPIMGVGYDRNVSQWSKGEYRRANNTQDDLATIAGKISYRNDDHGGTAASATPLVITSQTNIVSTTPETDPSNSSPANKGVLGRNNDTDVFSFATGSGPIRLTVRPWVTPGGITRGGNLDVLLELRSGGGTLLATNNPASQTGAEIQTTVPAGRYYLTVRNSGAGTPQGETATGYTSYGSLGQYFITGTIVETSGLIFPPLAELQATELTASGVAEFLFTVTYSDDVGVDVTTVDSEDIRVTGPRNYDQLARLVSIDEPSNGTPRVATYAARAPNGQTWDSSDNGTYSVSMEPSQVKDTSNAFVPAGQIGQFVVAVPRALYVAFLEENPGWTLNSQWAWGTPRYTSGGPTSGFTGSRIIGYNLGGNYAVNLTTRNATTPVIDCSSVTSVLLRFKRWLRVHSSDNVSILVTTNGTTWSTVWQNNGSVLDSSWQEVQYGVPDGVAGSPTVRFRWSLSSGPDPNVDIGWNLDDIEVIGAGFIDTKPPTAELLVANLVSKGAPSHSCAVTFTDDTAVKLSSLDSGDLRVTGPNGYSKAVTFEGADLPLDGSPLTASYSIPAPGDFWLPADNGTYQITLTTNAVEDTLGFQTPAQVLGTFEVAIPAADPGRLEVTPADGLTAQGPAGGPFTPSSKVYTLANRGESALNWTADSLFGWIGVSATSGTLAPGETTTVTLAFTAEANALPGGETAGWVNFVNATSALGNSRRDVTVNVTATQSYELQVAVQPAGWGTVNPSGGSFPAATAVNLQATPATYYRFHQWQGDVAGTDNPIAIQMTANRTVTAVFAEIFTVNHPTPHWWLAEQGYTSNFETAVDQIGANGMPVWQSYIAGLDSRNPASKLILTPSVQSSGTGITLTWNTASGRTYTVKSSPSPGGPFTTLPGGENLPPTTTSLNLPFPATSAPTFYRVEVQKP